jgi:hypothetical protein
MTEEPTILSGDAGRLLPAARGYASPLALPGMESESVRLDDIVLTPLDVARDVVNHFKPSGRILDPCKGNGAFADLMPGCEWCEIREGRDFYNWREPVDWIVSNPPYSVFADFLRHSLTVAENIVYLIPVNKIFNSDRMMREIWTWGGVPEIYTVAGGGALGFPIGFAIGAVHFRRAYRGETRVTFRTHNNVLGDSVAKTKDTNALDKTT